MLAPYMLLILGSQLWWLCLALMTKKKKNKFLIMLVYSIIVMFCSWRILLYINTHALVLQACILLGFTLISQMVLDKLVDVKMEHHSVRNSIKAEEILLQERKLHMEDHLKVLQGKVAELTTKMKKLEMDCQMKANRAQAAGAIVLELKNQLEEFRLKYDRLLDYNQTLRNQLQSISHDVQKIDESDGWSNVNTKLGCPALENDGESVDFENVMEKTTKCSEYLFSTTQSSSSPRHRKPIFQF